MYNTPPAAFHIQDIDMQNRTFYKAVVHFLQSIYLKNYHFLQSGNKQLPAKCLKNVVFGRFHYTARLMTSQNEVFDSIKNYAQAGFHYTFFFLIRMCETIEIEQS